MVYLLSRSIAQGRKAGLIAACGINLGAYAHLTAAVLGLSAVLATSSMAFTVVKWVGAIYLIFIGLQAIRSKNGAPAVDGVSVRARCYRSIFWQGFWSDVLNPKVALFFLAFLPQFVDPAAQNTTATLILLGVTVNLIGITINVVLVMVSGVLTQKARARTGLSAWLNKAMGRHSGST